MENINALGTALINLELKDKKIAIISENRYEWEVAFFSIVCGDNIVIPIDKSLPKEEIQTIINRARIEAVFCSRKYEKTLEEIKKNNEFIKYIISFDGDTEISFSSLIEKGNSDFINTNINENNICSIFFTSGTTDKSKAIMLSHKNICTNIINVSKVFNLTENDISLSVLPLNHVLEGLFCFLLSLYNGSQRVFCNEIDEITEYIKKYKITFMGAVPGIYEYLDNKMDELKLEANHINMFMSGGAFLDTNIIEDFEANGIELIQGYGLTECSPVVCIENKSSRKIGTVRKMYSRSRNKTIKSRRRRNRRNSCSRR